MTDALVVAETDIRFDALVADILAIRVEREFVIRWELIRLYHEVGQRILDDPEYRKWKRDREFLSRVTLHTGITRQNLYRAIRFYRKFPDLDMLPAGKNTTWHDIVNLYLPDKVEPSNNEQYYKFVNRMQKFFEWDPLPTWDADKQNRFMAWKQAGKEFVE